MLKKEVEFQLKVIKGIFRDFWVTQAPYCFDTHRDCSDRYSLKKFMFKITICYDFMLARYEG